MIDTIVFNTILFIAILVVIIWIVYNKMAEFWDDPASYYAVFEDIPEEPVSLQPVQPKRKVKLDFETRLMHTSFPILFPTCTFLSCLIYLLSTFVINEGYLPSVAMSNITCVACVIMDVLSALVVIREYIEKGREVST